MHRAAKADANQTEIVTVLRKMGATVQHIHTVGQGCPDLLVGFMGVNILVEVKDGSKPPSKRQLTPDEVEWHEAWQGQVVIVDSIDDAVGLLNFVTGVTSSVDLSLLRTIQTQDAEIQRLKAELAKVRA